MCICVIVNIVVIYCMSDWYSWLALLLPPWLWFCHESEYYRVIDFLVRQQMWSVHFQKLEPCKENGQVIMFLNNISNKWMFPKIGVPQNGWFIIENPIKMDDLGVHGGTIIFGNTQITLKQIQQTPPIHRWQGHHMRLDKTTKSTTDWNPTESLASYISLALHCSTSTILTTLDQRPRKNCLENRGSYKQKDSLPKGAEKKNNITISHLEASPGRKHVFHLKFNMFWFSILGFAFVQVFRPIQWEFVESGVRFQLSLSFSF